jgi:putative transposase
MIWILPYLRSIKHAIALLALLSRRSKRGIGHMKRKSTTKIQTKQMSFFKTDWRHSLSHGGILRKSRKGRRQRPLSCSEPLHVVFKAARENLPRKSFRNPFNMTLIKSIVQLYSKKFAIKIEQISIQHDHIHILIRTSRRSHFHHFFRVMAGQIAQKLQISNLSKVTDTSRRATPKDEKKNKLWKFRPFSRVVRGWKAYQIAQKYILLNEKEALGKITYRKNRLGGLSASELLELTTKIGDRVLVS